MTATVDQSPNPSALNLSAASDCMLSNGSCTRPDRHRLRLRGDFEACGFFQTTIEISRPLPLEVHRSIYRSARRGSIQSGAEPALIIQAVLLHRGSANVPLCVPRELGRGSAQRADRAFRATRIPRVVAPLPAVCAALRGIVR
ncbi:MAG: hypothetical protein LC808_11595, partial [Actinobacteria bacterium]|nr:hypothetical protein [Actinomycetota bacterium]